MSACVRCLIDKNICLNQLNDGYPSQTVYYQSGDLIFDENRQLKGVYCIKKGVCKISKTSANGKEQIIHFLKEGTLLGIRSLLNGEATNLKAEAPSPIEACFIDKKRFFDTLRNHRHFLDHLLETFAEYLRVTDDRIVSMGQNKMMERLALFLIKLQADFGTDHNGNLGLYLKREDMANYMGVRVESTIRMLKVFEQNGLIALNNKSLKLVDLPRLENISRGFNI
ncbi:MAG: Crp/Fnr family transcriptional regulator [Flavobacteriia bacterium]|nr:Crp/Fnr family transcriptional regulator [Flavobacteriia bacterium]